ncbi:MAG TPA: ABC transporter substrate-binding protein, partial [Paracoccus sp.]|nr:ABC transporter substrate-binding protein [Paracoccus sp. (in: a-proteobacteria)]
MPNSTRRDFLGRGVLAVAVLAALPAQALTGNQAIALVRATVDEVLATVNSGRAPAQMYPAFETIFNRRADIDAMARAALGPTARQLGAQDFAAFRQAMSGYVARKYGKRFQEFLGARIEIGAARQLKSFWSVDSTAYLRGQSPTRVEWHVSDRSGQVRFFNLIIEGVNMLASER